MEQQAIEAALYGNWQKAIEINKEILKLNKGNLEALSRLAYGYAKCRDFKKACSTYKKLLKIDPSNPIACRNFAKFKEAKISQKKEPPAEARSRISPSLFLSELAKAKSVNLINIASMSVLQSLLVGDEVVVHRRRFDLQVKDKNGTYLGCFPDDVGRKIIGIFEHCRSVKFFLKNVQENQVTIFVKWN